MHPLPVELKLRLRLAQVSAQRVGAQPPRPHRPWQRRLPGSEPQPLAPVRTARVGVGVGIGVGVGVSVGGCGSFRLAACGGDERRRGRWRRGRRRQGRWREGRG